MRGGERRVDTSTDAHHHLLEAVLAHVVTHPQAQGGVHFRLHAQAVGDGAAVERRRSGGRRGGGR